MRRRFRRFTQPPIERIATIPEWDRLLTDTGRAVIRAGQTQVKVIFMIEPGSDLAEPVSVPLGRSAKLLLDSGVDENTVRLGVLGGSLQDDGMILVPKIVVEAIADGTEKAKGLDVGAVLVRFQMKRRMEVKPDIDIETGLMAAMAKRHGATPSHPEVTHMKNAKAASGSSP